MNADKIPPAGGLRMRDTGRDFSRRVAVCVVCAVLGFLAACKSAGAHAPILLFNGRGTSPGDVEALETILREHRLAYVTVDSRRLNGMSEAELREAQLLIVPGGNFVTMGNGLGPATTASVREAVKGGLNYLGVCAGGFLAGRFPAPHQSFDLTSGVKFGFYSLEGAGVRKAAVRIATADGAALDQYWEDGPVLSGWGDVVGKYPDGTPAIVEAAVGNGWVILSGVHPEAPNGWRRGMSFGTPAEADQDYAALLIDAALNGRRLPHY